MLLDVETRTTPGTLRMDDSEDFQAPILRGRAIVFDSLSVDLGGFRERIRAEAIERTLRDGLDVRALRDHEPDKILGRTHATPPTLRLMAARGALEAEITMPNVSYARDLAVSVRRGDVSGMSFAFRSLDDAWSMEQGQVVREVRDMLVYDVSVVTFPAYPATTVSVRALRAYEAFAGQLESETSRRYLAQNLARRHALARAMWT